MLNAFPLLAGCGSEQSWIAINDPDLARAIAAAGQGPREDAVARAQMPDTKTKLKPTQRAIDMPPERSADIANAPAVTQAPS